MLLIEPLADLAALAGAKALRDTGVARLLAPRLYRSA